MQKEFAAAIRKLFDENSHGLRTYSRKDATGEFSAGLIDEESGIELWLRFPAKKEAFALVFVCPPNASEWTDLFRFDPLTNPDVDGFWIEARFLDSIEDEVGDHAFELKPPSVKHVTEAIGKSRHSHETIARKLGFSVEKVLRLKDGYYLSRPSEVTQTFLRTMPEWPTLAGVARPTKRDAEEITADFPRVLGTVIRLGLPEFKLKVAMSRSSLGML